MSKHKRRKQSRHPCPLCAEPRPNPGLPITIPFGIPTYWSPEAALAIFELIDEMRDIILAVYDTYLQDAARDNGNRRQPIGWPSRTMSCRFDWRPAQRRGRRPRCFAELQNSKKSGATLSNAFTQIPAPQHTGKKLRNRAGANTWRVPLCETEERFAGTWWARLLRKPAEQCRSSS